MSTSDIQKVQYRFHDSADIASIAKIEKEAFSVPWSENAIEDFSCTSTGKILVAATDDVVGYITFSLVLDEIQIANIAVAKQHRRCGIAENLLKYIFDYAKRNDVSLITLEVRKSNIAALGLYCKMGYQQVGVLKNHYSDPKEDAILMNLTLT